MTGKHLAFAGTSLAPVPLLLLAAAFGGAWSWAALLYLTVFAFAMDELVGQFEDDSREFPAGDALLLTLGVAHFVVLGAVVWRFGAGGIGLWSGGALFAAAGLFMGQISNANAHELIHRGARLFHRLGAAVYVSLLFGHHSSAHTLVHHRFVASEDDPNTARLGESFYSFAPRAWAGSFRAGLEAELARRPGASWRQTPYATYAAGSMVVLVAALAVGGWFGFLMFLALAIFAQLQLLLSDYVQHYGLTRSRRGERLEPVGSAHSWNAPQVFTSHMMLHAPRHSAHHAQPAKPFHDLDLPEPGEGPMLPYSLPTMSLIALAPPLWRRVIDPRLAYWQSVPLYQQAA